MNATLNETEMAYFTGDLERWRHWLRVANMLMTPGVKYLCDHGCAWLVDAIASYQTDKRLRRNPKLQEMQFWTLEVTEKSGVLYCTDGDSKKRVIEQQIEYTDCNLRKVEVWLETNGDGTMTALLPSEH